VKLRIVDFEVPLICPSGSYVLMGDALSEVWTGSPVPGAHRQILTRRQMKQGGRVVPDKRTISVAGGLLVAAALALAACAPSGYNNTDSSAGNNAGAAPALANATGAPDASASADASANSNTSNTGTTSNVDFTTELNSKIVAKMGNVVTNQKGFVLYRFDKDSANPPKTACVAKCALVWPPALTDGNPALSGVSADLVGTVTRPDGTRQITIGGWPAYSYIGDPAPGKWTGQGVGGTWWVMNKQGKKNLTCVPTGTPTAVAPPADSSSSNSTSSGSDSASSSAGSSGYGY
jgi:predicted lipoprotein with Yx(FWY)xxD motif